jgi:alpha-L-rhamnosidase
MGKKIMLKITELKTEYRLNPIGIDVQRPRFSWILESAQNDTLQKSYRLRISANDGEDNVVYDSGEVESVEPVLIEYAGNLLFPQSRYTISLLERPI